MIFILDFVCLLTKFDILIKNGISYVYIQQKQKFFRNIYWINGMNKQTKRMNKQIKF